MKISWLKYLIAISALLIAGSAAYFSVTGLGVLFSGAAIAVMIMAGSLEFAKLVTATYLKQKWDEIKGINKWYLTIAVVILMTITSAGIFGYLSNAFQQQNLKLEQVQREIDVWNNKIKTDSSQITLYTNQLNQLQSNNTTVLNKNTNKSSLKFATTTSNEQSKIRTKISILNDSLVAYNGHINDIKNNNIGIEKEVGGFRFVAEAFNVKLNTVVKFFIILIVVVFDPLAIALVIAFNQLLLEGKKEEPTSDTIAENEIPLILSKDDLAILEKHLFSKTPVEPNDALKEAAEEYKEKEKEKNKPWINIPDEVWERMKKYEARREAIHGPILPEDEPTGALANSGYREKMDSDDEIELPEREPFGEMMFKEDYSRMDIIGQNGNEGLHYFNETPQEEPTLDEEEKNYATIPPIIENELRDDVEIVEITHNATSLDGFTPIPYGEEILEPVDDFGIEETKVNEVLTEMQNETFSTEPTKLEITETISNQSDSEEEKKNS